MKKFPDRERDEFGFIITNHNDRSGKGSVYEYNRMVAKAAQARINRAAKLGVRPNMRDIKIVYGA